MRTENSIKNSISAVISNVFVMLLGFLIQTVFVKTLGKEYLGVVGLFNNIISCLAIVELGIGPAIVSNLYKPLAEGDEEQIKTLLQYYKKCYTGIGFLVLIIGVAIMPLLKFFVKTTAEFNNFGGIYFIFLLFVADSAISYFYSYKRSIIQADQKSRVINNAHLVCYTLMIALQALVLILTKNYILFLVLKIVFRFLENLILSYYVDKNYKFLKGTAKKIEKQVKVNVFKKVKGLIYHKVGVYVVSGTDNIIISAFLGVGLVGIYSNYYLIINSLYTLYCQIFASIMASVGNLIFTETKERNYNIYKKVMFLDFWIYGFSSAAIFCMMTPFVNVWLGKDFLLSTEILAILVINFYTLGMRSSIGIFKEAAGIFHEDRFIPICEAIINIAASLIFVKFLGLFGVFLGTLCSSLIAIFYSLPHYVFKPIFGQKKRYYYLLYFKYIFIAAIGVLGTVGVYKLILALAPVSGLLSLCVSIIVSLIVPNTIFILLLGRTEEFKYFKNIAFSKLRRNGDA